MVLETVLGIIVVGVLALLGYKFRAFDLKGIFMGIFLLYSILFLTGLKWLIIIVIFVIVGSLFTRFKRPLKTNLLKESLYYKRGWKNVLANGFVPLIFSFLEFLSLDGSIFIVAFGSSIAAACSDTLATEIGILSKSKPRMIFNPKKVVPIGTSGGVTPLGLLASFFGSLTISLPFTYIGILPPSLPLFLSLLLAGIIGCLFDSILGQLLQFKGICLVCNEETENKIHHEKRVKKIKGFEFIDNNMVNLLSILIGSLFGMYIFSLF